MSFKNFQLIEGPEVQTTVKSPIKIVGLSLTHGNKCTAEIRPALADHGLVFQVNNLKIPAAFQFMKKISDEHTTCLERNGVEIRTVEHLLSALWGLGIDNAVITLTDGEIPLLDGSAEKYSQKIREAGIKNLKKPRKFLKIKKEFNFKYSCDFTREIVLKPSSQLTLDVTSDFNNLVGRQSFSHQWSPENYLKDISWARSFLISPLKAEDPDKWERIRSKLKLLPPDPKKSPIIVFTETEFLTPLKVDNEPVRHKTLDFYGDTALLGIRLKANVTVMKPGHQFTREFVDCVGKLLPTIKS